MSKWKQVSGDMDFAGVGCVLARTDKKHGSVELVQITPWLEMDSDALKAGYGFWDVSTTTIDYSDMGVDKPDVKSAMSYVGMDAAEYKKLEPAYKAEIIASASGYGNSRSTNDFADALPAPIEEIEFYSGSASKKDIKDINDHMRFEVISKLYGGDYRGEKIPDDDILEMAFGDEKRTFGITEDEAQAIRYAHAIADGTYNWTFPKAKLDTSLTLKDSAALKELLDILANTPDSSDLPPHKITHLQSIYEQTFDLDWEDKREQVANMIDEDAKAAHNLIGELLSQLGF
jgi:hypothetical protein